eukprot:Clim_evm1s216 gene=Clim_evmTU1s216
MVRVKYRYVVVHWDLLLSDEAETHKVKGKGGSGKADLVDAKELRTILRSAVQEFHGDFGSATIASSLALKYTNSSTSTCIIRILRDVTEVLISVVPLITKLKGRPARLTVGYVGGTIRACQKHIVRRTRADIQRLMRLPSTTDADREALAQVLATVPVEVHKVKAW